MACPICGKNCNIINPSPGAGLTVTRLKPEGSTDMAKVTLSKERWYVTADRTRKVPVGSQEAAYLLVGKGSPIAPEVAAHYGIETYLGDSISKMPLDADAEKTGMVTPGTPAKSLETYETMRITREVNDKVNDSITGAGIPGASKQAAMMAHGIIHEMKQEGSLVSQSVREAAAPNEPSRTKEIAPPFPTKGNPSMEPDAGSGTQTPLAGANPLEGELEADEAASKAL